MIRIYKTENKIVLEQEGTCYTTSQTDWDAFVNRENLYESVQQEIKDLIPVGDQRWLLQQQILPPIGSQEVWAAGVTYLRSKTARMEESKDAGGGTFYDKVYHAERPELFFKG